MAARTVVLTVVLVVVPTAVPMAVLMAVLTVALTVALTVVPTVVPTVALTVARTLVPMWAAGSPAPMTRWAPERPPWAVPTMLPSAGPTPVTRSIAGSR